MKWTCAKIDELLSDETLLDVLMDKGLLAKDPACSKCEKTMKLRKRRACKDGYEVSLFLNLLYICVFQWRCRKSKKKECSTRSVRTGSWFARSKLSLAVIVKIVIMWANKISSVAIHQELGVAESTLVDVKNFCRQVCGW
jgi:hypothetical protein